jgi:hypothetical protein
MTTIIMTQKTPEESLQSEKAEIFFNSLLTGARQEKLDDTQITVILDALANAKDNEIVLRFPAVLAIYARRGLALNYQALFSRYVETSPTRQNLEKLLLASAIVFNLQGLEPPKNLIEIAASLKRKYGDLLSRGKLVLSDGRHITIKDLQQSLKAYTADRPKSQAHQDKTPAAPSNTLDGYLNRLFSAKQKELVFKKREGHRMTKTEREYFSRIVRKKLEAIANEEVVNLARKLIHRKRTSHKAHRVERLANHD